MMRKIDGKVQVMVEEGSDRDFQSCNKFDEIASCAVRLLVNLGS